MARQDFSYNSNTEKLKSENSSSINEEVNPPNSDAVNIFKKKFKKNFQNFISRF